MSARRPRPAAQAMQRAIHGPDRESGWMARAACRDSPDVDFFPSDGAGVLVARHVCARCPVRQPCLDYALDNFITHGVWGGTSDRERQRMRADRAQAG